MSGTSQHGTASGSADCSECPLVSSRRDFVGRALAALAGIATLGVARSALAQGMVREVRSAGSAGALHNYPIPDADGVHIDRDNDVILVRWEKSVYAFNLSCPHQNTALRWDEADHRFQCPKHHSKYRPDGEFIEGRATRGMDRLGIKREGTSLVVDLDRLIKQDVDPAGWKGAVVSLSA